MRLVHSTFVGLFACAACLKLDLSAAMVAAAVLILPLSALAATNPLAPPSFVLQCEEVNQQVWIKNVGAAPVPAGTVSKWQIPKRVVQEQGVNYTEVALSGIYKFSQPLNQQGTVALNIGPTPAPVPSNAPPPDPATQMAVALLLAGLMPRACTIGVATSSDLLQARPFHVVAVNPGTPTGVSAGRAGADTVFLTWVGGVATAHFYVFDITTASNPPSDYHNWRNPVIVEGNVLKATVSISRATKPQTNYYMVCAANAGSTIVNCSQPLAESIVPLTPQQGPLVRPH